MNEEYKIILKNDDILIRSGHYDGPEEARKALIEMLTTEYKDTVFTKIKMKPMDDKDYHDEQRYKKIGESYWDTFTTGTLELIKKRLLIYKVMETLSTLG